jgi:hypothetical protein
MPNAHRSRDVLELLISGVVPDKVELAGTVLIDRDPK